MALFHELSYGGGILCRHRYRERNPNCTDSYSDSCQGTATTVTQPNWRKICHVTAQSLNNFWMSLIGFANRLCFFSIVLQRNLKHVLIPVDKVCCQAFPHVLCIRCITVKCSSSSVDFSHFILTALK